MLNQTRPKQNKAAHERRKALLLSARTHIATTLGAFARDIRRLATSPVALTIVLGACLMPSVYAWYCIAANWDPYQHTDAIKVAVVNLDEGADVSNAYLPQNDQAKEDPEEGGAPNAEPEVETYASEADAQLTEAGSVQDTSDELVTHINIGNKVVGKLRDNHQLGWEFTTEDDALQGVRSGAYYAAILIPASFSADFASIVSGNFTRPTIDYYVNEKLSAVAPKITDTGATALERTIDDAFVATVSEAVAETLRDVGATANSGASSMLETLTETLEEVRANIAEAQDALDSLSTAARFAQDAAHEAQRTLTLAETTLAQLDESLEDATGELEAARELVRTSSLPDAQRLAPTLLDAANAVQKHLDSAQETIGEHKAYAEQALEQIEQARAANDEAIASLEALPESATGIAPVIEQLQSQNTQLENAATALRSAIAAAHSASSSATSATTALGELTRIFGDANNGGESPSELASEAASQANAALDKAELALSALKGGSAALELFIAYAHAQVAQLEAVVGQATQLANSTSTSLASTDAALSALITDAHALRSASSAQVAAMFAGSNPQDIASFMASPVHLDTRVLFPVENYGSGVAPFYISLALWVTCFILAAIVRTRAGESNAGLLTPVQEYFARLLLFVVLALFAASVIGAGCLVMGVQCASVPAFMGTIYLTVFVDICFVYALVVAFRHVGRALAVVLLIMQIPGSSGMYPIEMMPAFFGFIHPALPFTYSIAALREAIGGMNAPSYFAALAHLLPFLLLAFLIGLGGSALLKRPTSAFDNKLAESNLFEAEPTPEGRTAHRSPSHAKHFVSLNFATFERVYPTLQRAGWVAVLALVAIVLVFMAASHANVDGKVALLAAMVACLFVVASYLIALEVVRESMPRKQNGARSARQPDARSNRSKHQRLGFKGSKAANSNVVALFLADLGGLMRNAITVIVAIGLVLLPALYAWFITLGFWDPYANTGNLKVAVANNDAGYRSDTLPIDVDAGQSVVSALHENDQFDWQFVSESDAVEGVKNGAYYAAIVIPSTFSADLMSAFSAADSATARIDYYTNQKENAIAPHVTDTGASALQQQIDETFTATVGKIALESLDSTASLANDNTVTAFAQLLLDCANAAIEQLDTASGTMQALAGLTESAANLASSGKSLSPQAENAIAALEPLLSEARNNLDSATNTIDDIPNNDSDTAAENLKEAAERLREQLQIAEETARSLETEAKTTHTKIVNANALLAKSLEQLSATLTSTSTTLERASGNLTETKSQVEAALEQGDTAAMRALLKSDPASLSNFVAKPTNLVRYAIYPMANNGSAMSPFYTTLCIWVGSVFLIALMQTSVSPARRAAIRAKTGRVLTSSQEYVGRFGVFALMALAQATTACLGNIFFLGVQCEHTGLYLLCGWATALVFSCIVYTLVASFGNVGKALAIIGLVLQLAGSGGIFPVQMSAPLFQAIYPWLPFTHAMEAFQSAVAGIYVAPTAHTSTLAGFIAAIAGNDYWLSLITLLCFLAPTLIVGLVLHRPITKLNAWVAGKLEETELLQ